MLSGFTLGRTHSNLIVIEDEVSKSGKNLMKSFISNASSRQLQTHILCFENPVEKWKHILKDHIHVHDCFLDPQGWNKDHVNNYLHHIYWEKGLLGVVQELLTYEALPALVCIDSLNPIIANCGLYKCYRDLHALIAWSRREEKKLNQLICIVHRDAISNKLTTLAQLRHLASTVFQIEPCVNPSVPGWDAVFITHRKSGGKVIKQIEDFYVDKDYIVTSKERKKCNPSAAAENVDPSAAVQNLTTFKLTLNPQEEKARSQLVLPYTRKCKGEESSGGGKVFYEPDAADDWDDEDPDDDLDV